MGDIAEKDRYFTIQWVAKRLNCSEQHVYLLLRQGKIMAIRIGDRAMRISEQSFDRFIEENIIDPDEFFETNDDKKNK